MRVCVMCMRVLENRENISTVSTDVCKETVEVTYFCLRSRPVSPNVVCSLVRPLVVTLKIVTE